VPFVAELRRLVAGGEDKLESTAVDCALVFIVAGSTCFECVIAVRTG
jgi:hypothetical protein